MNKPRYMRQVHTADCCQIKKYFIAGFLAVLCLCIIYTNAQAEMNIYQNCKEFTLIQVQSHDTLWSIAEKHATKQQDIRLLISVIRTLNGLDDASAIYPGQQIKVPLLTAQADSNQR